LVKRLNFHIIIRKLVIICLFTSFLRGDYEDIKIRNTKESSIIMTLILNYFRNQTINFSDQMMITEPLNLLKIPREYSTIKLTKAGVAEIRKHFQINNN
jgi:hypothetical protein